MTNPKISQIDFREGRRPDGRNDQAKHLKPTLSERLGV